MTEPLTQIDGGVWIGTVPAKVLGMQLTASMTVLLLRDASLLLYSPVVMSPERRAAVEALGSVEHLYVPNLYHHSWVSQWAEAFPSAKVHGPAGLAKKRPDLRVDRVHHSEEEPAFEGVVDELAIEGFRLEESVLFYRPANTLVVADLVHNIGRPPQAWTKFYAGLMGFYDRVALSRMIRWLGFSDRAAARRSLDELLALPFERLIVGHGAPLGDVGRHDLAAAFAWLGVRPTDDGEKR